MNPVIGAVLIPLVAAAAALWATWPARGASLARSGWVSGLVLLVAYLPGHVLTKGGLPSWPPVDAMNWAPIFAVAALLLLVADDQRPFPALVRHAMRVALAVGLPLLLLGRMHVYWGMSTTVIGVGTSALAILLVWYALEGARSSDGVAEPFAMGAALALGIGASIANVTSGSIIIGLIIASVCAGWGVLALGVVVLGRVPLGRSGLGLFVLILGAMGTVGYFYSDLPASNVALLVGAACAAWFSRLPPVARLSPTIAVFAGVALALLPGIAAIVVNLLGDGMAPEVGPYYR